MCAYDGAGNISSGVTAEARPAPEFDAPVGTISLESGATYAGSGPLSVAVSATDASTVALMCFSTDPESCEDWVEYDPAGVATVPAVEGSATVYAWFEDEWGNTSATPVSDSILLDLTAPTNGTATSSSSIDTSALVSWSGFSDAGAGLASYKVVHATGTTAPADCNTGTVGYTGTATSQTINGLVSGTTYSFRVCAIDNVGNLSSGTSTTVTTPDTQAPSGTVSINAGAIGTKTTAVTLTFAPTETVSQVCVSNTTTCTTFAAYTATKAWTLATGAGVKTVYVKYKDAAGNISSLISDTIILDATAPTNGTLTATNTVVAQIGLTWTGFSDAGSGIANYKVVYAQSTTAPSSCTAGTVLYTGTSTSYTHTGLTTGKKYSYRVCAVDNAGNTSTGAAKAGIAAK